MIYKLNLSNKEVVTLNEDEFLKFKDNISANFIEFESGIINPSFVVSIIIDEEETDKDNKNKMKFLTKDVMSQVDYEQATLLYNSNSIKEVKELSSILKKYDNELLRLK